MVNSVSCILQEILRTIVFWDLMFSHRGTSLIPLHFIIRTTKSMTIQGLNQKLGLKVVVHLYSQTNLQWGHEYSGSRCLYYRLSYGGLLDIYIFPANTIFINIFRQSGMYSSAASLDAISALDGYTSLDCLMVLISFLISSAAVLIM